MSWDELVDANPVAYLVVRVSFAPPIREVLSVQKATCLDEARRRLIAARVEGAYPISMTLTLAPSDWARWRCNLKLAG